MQLRRDLQDKQARLEYIDGEIAEVKVVLVDECPEHEDCRGLVYDLITTNRPKRERKGSYCWAHSREILRFEVIGE